MKTLKYIIALVAAGMTAACANDGELLTVSPAQAAGDLAADQSQVELLVENADNLALTLSWTLSAPSVSNPSVSLPDGVTTYTLQMAAEQTFATPFEYAVSNGSSSLQFTVEQLNHVMSKLGFTTAEYHDVYVRMKSETLSYEPTYSTVLTLSIAPYVVDTSKMEMRTKDLSTVFATLRNSDAAPTLYEGFAVLSAWVNFYFVAADGTVWGNDGDTGVPFEISTADSKWNCWSAETSGCHYVFMDTQNKVWSQVYMPAVKATVEGSEVTMKFSSSAKTWTATITTTSANQTVTLAGDGALYDKSVGTDSGAANIAYPYAIDVASDGTFAFTQSATVGGVEVAAAGTYTLTLDIATQTVALTEGGVVPPTVTYPDALYAYYYKKESSEKLALVTAMATTQTEGEYEGFIYTDPAWGDTTSNFRFCTTTDDTATVYGTNSSQYALSSDSSIWNLWSSNTALNYVTVDLADMSWSETVVAQVAVTGDFNSWSISADVMQYDASTGKWTATCNIATIGYGIKFVLGDADNAWRWMYADADGDGVLSTTSGSDNIAIAETGTYVIELTLNSFAAPTYTITKQ